MPRRFGLPALLLGIGFPIFSFFLYIAVPSPKDLVRADGPPPSAAAVSSAFPRAAAARETAPSHPSREFEKPVPAHSTKQEGSRPAFDITLRKELPPLDSERNYIDWMRKNTQQTEPHLTAKWGRFQEALRRKDITEDRVLQAVLMAPREYFCRSYNMKRAYDDAAMPIGHGQTISGPHMVSRMTQSLGLRPHHRVLEIGTGSGYQAAVLAELSNYVYTIEIVPELTAETDAIYEKLEKDYPQYRNVKRKNSDGYYGWEEFAPFDRIIVTCGIDHIPPPLLRQLSPGGIMVIPVGPPSGQTVMKVTKTLNPDGTLSLEREDIFHGRKVIFVPFTAGKGEVHSLEKDGKKETP